MTIFVVIKPKPGPQGYTYDISPAQEYGEIDFIFDAYENPSSNPRGALERLRLKLGKYNPKTDYIVTAGGDPYASILVGFVLCELNLPVRYLRFERLRGRSTVDAPAAAGNAPSKTGYYIPVEIPSSAY